MSQELPAVYVAFKEAFATVLQHPGFARLTKDLFEVTPRASEAFLHSTLPLIHEKPSDPNYNTAVIVQRLFAQQAARIDRYLNVGEAKGRIAFYCPSRAYRQTFGDADMRLREKGMRVVKLFSEFADDKYEQSEGAFFASDVVLQKLTKLDIMFLSTLIDFPTPFRRILSVHDIFDSPLGDEAEFRRMARNCDGFFMPSTLGVESIQRVFGPIAKPDDPAAGGKRYVIIRGGYSRLDQNIAYFKQHAVEEKTIIYAPTAALPAFGRYVSMPHWAEPIVEMLMERFPDYRVIFRPHPHTFVHGWGNEAVQKILARYGSDPRFQLDTQGTDYMASYSRAALMISDTSGTAYTYAFTTGRPVVFFSPFDEEARAMNPGVRYFEFRESVGLVAYDIDGLQSQVNAALNNRERIREVSLKTRDEVVFNVGRASEYFTSIVPHLQNGTDIPDAIYFRA